MRGDNNRINMDMSAHKCVKRPDTLYFELPNRPGVFADIKDINRDEQGPYITTCVTPLWKLYWQTDTPERTY
jgi:hypothetical protein